MKKLIIFSFLVGRVFSETLPTIVVDSNKESSTNISTFKVNSKQIESSIQGNGDIGSAIKLNPNVKVQDKNKNREAITEITPSRIEINGAKFYQNSVLIDGISNDSLLDPLSEDKDAVLDVPGNENATFIDLDLIDSIEVLDSNIPAKYGNFTGGVINAKTKRADFTTKARIKYKTTNDKYVNFHLKPVKNQDDAIDVMSLNKMKFEKTFLNTYFSKAINDKSAFWVNYTYKEVTKPKLYFKDFRETKATNHNFLAKYSYFFDDDSIADFSFLYAPYEEKLFRKEVKDSDYTNTGGGLSLKTNYEKNFDFWNLKADFDISRNENSRKDSKKDYKAWIKQVPGNKNWGLQKSQGTIYSKEGGYGNIDKTEDNIKTSFDFESRPFLLGNLENKLNTGLQLSYAKSNYLRKENTYSYYAPKKSSGIDCNGYTDDCDGEQYFTKRTIYQKEDVNVDIAKIALYLDDKITYKKFEFTPGLRVDYNSFLKNFDPAPRLNTSYDIFGNGNTQIFGGLNRYYGKSFLGFKLREARSPYRTEYRTSYRGELNSLRVNAGAINPTVWNTSVDQGFDKYVYKDLDTPYSDEQVIGFKQKYKNNEFLIKYVKREDKNQFVEQRGEPKVFTRPDGLLAYYRPLSITNTGKSENSNLSIILKNQKGINLGFANLNYLFSTNIPIKNKSNYKNYNFSDDSLDKQYAFLNGEKVKYNDFPDEEESKEFNLNLTFDEMKLNLFGLNSKFTFSNNFKYYTKYKINHKEDYVKVLKGTSPNIHIADKDGSVFSTKEYPAYWTLDSKVSMDFKLKGKHTFNTSFEVINVFDKKREQSIEENFYDIGRQFWFELAYKF